MMWSRTGLLQDLCDGAGADGAAALADREAQPLLHRDRRDQLDPYLRVVPGHHHLHPVRQRRHSRHVRRPEVELRPVAREERRVAAAPLPLPHLHPPGPRGARGPPGPPPPPPPPPPPRGPAHPADPRCCPPPHPRPAAS